MPKAREVNLAVIDGDILEVESSVAIFKFAQALHGADRVAYAALREAGVHVELPDIHDYTLVDTQRSILPRKILFFGVEPLTRFGYPEIRRFAHLALAAVGDEEPLARTVSITLHGPGYGLDEIESFHAEVAGLIDAIQTGQAPKQLLQVAIVERNPERAERLRQLLAELLPTGNIVIHSSGRIEPLEKERAEIVRAAGVEATRKVHVFVAMPFNEKMEDVFELGIKPAVHERGFLCERADLATFVGDTNAWVRQRIANADMVVADLTGANANVYLEVGYAWGTGRPTVLVAERKTKLMFDVQTQRCLLYKNITELKAKLAVELEGLTRNAIAVSNTA